MGFKIDKNRYRELGFLIRKFRAKRLLGEKSEAQVLWGRILDFEEFGEIRRRWEAEMVLKNMREGKNMGEEKIISLKIKVSKVIEIPHLNVTLEEAEGVIEKWVEQKIEIGDAYTIEGMTDSGRTIEFMRRDSQPVSVEAKPGIFQKMLSRFKKV